MPKNSEVCRQSIENTTTAAQINSQNTSRKQTLSRLHENIPSKSLVSLVKPAENILQDNMQTLLTSTETRDTLDTLNIFHQNTLNNHHH